MWNKGEVEQAFNKFGKETIQQARTNLTKGNHNVSKGLYNELSFKYEGSPNSFRFTLSAPEYWKYLDQGVKGSKSSSKAPDSPYKYTNKKPPIKAIESWVSARRFQFRDNRGRFLSYRSTAYAVREGIFKYGITATKFLSRAFELKWKRFQAQLKEAVKLDMENLLNFVIRN